MKASVIAIPNHAVSQKAALSCIKSSKDVGNTFDIHQFEAITPDLVDDMMKAEGIEWNYPWQGEVLDFSTGLKKSAYRTANPKARIACALSHYSLWKLCAADDVPYLILEHDAKFIKKFERPKTKYAIFGINNPIGATRRSRQFKEGIVGNDPVVPVPWVDDRNVPQGLAGNSAYIIKPRGAKTMLKLVNEYGLWPNDSLMCKQLIPALGVTTTFYTTIQGTPSTTAD